MDPRIANLTPDPDGWRDATALDLCNVVVMGESITKLRLGDQLVGARFENVELTEVEIHGKTIENVQFVNCRFKNCVMSSTWFSRCTFKHSTFDRCTFTSSVFVRCDLYRVVYVSNNLMENTCFRLVSISQATLSGTIGLRRVAFDPRANPLRETPPDTQPGRVLAQASQVAGTRLHAENPQARKALPRTALIQEDADRYTAFLEPIPDKTLDLSVSMGKRFGDAAEVWRCLSALWSSQGFAADAGWAYVRARRKERSDSAPTHTAGMKLWTRGWHALRWGVLLMADALCEFGNNLLLAIAWLPVLVVGTGLIFWCSGIVHTATGPASFWKSMLFSVTQMVNVSPGGLSAEGSAAHVIAAAEVFLGVALLGLIGFVLGNKIRNS